MGESSHFREKDKYVTTLLPSQVPVVTLVDYHVIPGLSIVRIFVSYPGLTAALP